MTRNELIRIGLVASLGLLLACNDSTSGTGSQSGALTCYDLNGDHIIDASDCVREPNPDAATPGFTCYDRDNDGEIEDCDDGGNSDRFQCADDDGDGTNDYCCEIEDGGTEIDDCVWIPGKSPTPPMPNPGDRSCYDADGDNRQTTAAKSTTEGPKSRTAFRLVAAEERPRRTRHRPGRASITMATVRPTTAVRSRTDDSTTAARYPPDRLAAAVAVARASHSAPRARPTTSVAQATAKTITAVAKSTKARPSADLPGRARRARPGRRSS